MPGKLSRKQIRVLDDLFAGDIDVNEILQKYNVTAGMFNKWQEQEAFTAEFDNRIAALYRQGGLIIARYAAVAAAKLVQLTESENQETARKACLDIIQLPRPNAKKQSPSAENDEPNQPLQLSAETAGKLLAVLAEQ
jgi:hypothetical protein